MKTYPIAELFVAPQGEGIHVGVLMLFVRLAGCNVGRRYPKNMYDNQVVPIYSEQCTLYDGRHFGCDTNYQKAGDYTVDQILSHVPIHVSRICVTGGEPLLHDLWPLFSACRTAGIAVHLETSGTLLPNGTYMDMPTSVMNPFIAFSGTWIAVSPKKSSTSGPQLAMLQRADEIKILVDAEFSPNKLPFQDRIDWFNRENVFLQPINYENEVNPANMELAVHFQRTMFPKWRLSTQAHKTWHTR